MSSPAALEAVASRFLAFVVEAGAESPCSADWAGRIAEDREVLERLAALPEAKQQPNLVLAAARFHGVPAPGPYAGLRAALLDDDAVVSTIMSRSTQTNEVGRLAALMPALALLQARRDAPLALIEAGASAGLCLHPDAYAYDWPPLGALPADGLPVLHAEAAGPLPVPERPLTVAWRSGIDLHPLDVRDDDAAAWLEALVWPEQHERRRRLRDAIAVARREPSRLVRGDLLDLLEAEVDLAGGSGRVVVLHSAVIAYLDETGRRRFEALMQHLVRAGRCDWVSNEGDRVLPAITGTATAPGRPDERFVLGLNGRAVARTHGHGASLTWLP